MKKHNPYLLLLALLTISIGIKAAEVENGSNKCQFESRSNSVLLSESNTPESTCQTKTKKILLAYHEAFSEKNYTATFTTQQIVSGQEGESLKTTVVRKADHYRVENQYMLTLMGATETVTILHDSKVIVIQSINREEQKEMAAAMSLSQQTDSVLYYSSANTCGDGTFRLEFPPEKAWKVGNIKSMQVDFDSQTGEVSRNEMWYYQEDGTLAQHIVEHEAYSKTTEGLGFTNTPTEALLSNGKLAPKYAQYELRDLREGN